MPRGRHRRRTRHSPLAGVERLESRTLLTALVSGDFNGDGFADVAWGIPDAPVDGIEESGLVHVLYGGSSAGLASGIGISFPGPPFDTPGAQTWHQVNVLQGDSGDAGIAQGFAHFGTALAAGDFDADGFIDLAIGTPNFDETGTGVFLENAGLVHVLRGSPSGLMPANQVFSPTALLDASGDLSDVRFGFALTSGDFDGNEHDDLAIGTPGFDVGNRDEAGAVAVLSGTTAGLGVADRQVWTQDSPGILDNAQGDDRFGSALAAGDFNNDGRDDLAIGVPGEDDENFLLDDHDAGLVNVIYGAAAGLSQEGNQRWTQGDIEGFGTDRGDSFGETLAAGDFDGDGIDDLAIHADETFGTIPGLISDNVFFAGSVHVLYGSVFSGLQQERQQSFHEGTEGVNGSRGDFDDFGGALAAGDFNGDAHDELAVGTRGQRVDGVFNAGKVDVLHGTPSLGLDPQPTETINQNSFDIEGTADQSDRFGQAVTTGDFNRDGFGDLAVAVDDGDFGGLNVIYGSATGLTPEGDQLFLCNADGVGLHGSADNPPLVEPVDVDGSADDWLDVVATTYVAGDRAVATAPRDPDADSRFAAVVAPLPVAVPEAEPQHGLFVLVEYEGLTDLTFAEGEFIADITFPATQPAPLPPGPPPPEGPPEPPPPPDDDEPGPEMPGPEEPGMPMPLPRLVNDPITIQIRGAGGVVLPPPDSPPGDDDVALPPPDDDEGFLEEEEEDILVRVDLDGDGLADLEGSDLGIQVAVGFGSTRRDAPEHLIIELSLPLTLAPGFADPDGALPADGQAGVYAPDGGFWNVVVASDPDPSAPRGATSTVQAAAALVSIAPDGSTTANADVVPQQVVDIDVRPVHGKRDAGSGLPTGKPRIALRGRGVVPVAVFSTPGFDATTIDVDTVRLRNPADLARSAGAVGSRLRDVDHDGDQDLLLIFRKDDLIDSGAVTHASTAVVLTGETEDGRQFAGSDSIEVLPPRPRRPFHPFVRQLFERIDDFFARLARTFGADLDFLDLDFLDDDEDDGRRRRF